MPVRHRHAAFFAVLTPLLFAACAEQTTSPEPRLRRQFSEIEEELRLVGDPSNGPAAFLASVNQALAAQGAHYAVRQADLMVTAQADPNFETTVFANDRTHRLGYQFMAGDPRRATVGNMVHQATFSPLSFAPSGPGTVVDATSAINASFATWSKLQCGQLTIVNNTLPPNVFPSAILALPGFIQNPLLNDINTVGFLPGFVFDQLLGPGASQFVLGLTLPFTWIDPETGEPTDIDGDGQDDLAFAEIWYNAAFRWSTTGAGPTVDIESVTLHENGHALGLGHFGKIFATGNGKLHVAPRAVMNAAYLGPIRDPRGTDNGSFCSLWASWAK